MSLTVARTAEARFQEAATGARLYAWGARALYLGPALGLSPHRNAVGVLALGLDGPFGVAEDPRDPRSAYRACRSLVIAPDTLHHLRVEAGRMAFLYVDPLSRDLAGLRSLRQDETIALLRDLDAGSRDWAAVRAELSQALSGDAAPPDPRIAAALCDLHADPAARPTLDELARRAGLSASRFRHLFRAATGVTLRRYRLWVAMGAALRSVARGETLTTAALDAGFASSAHFSVAFRDMFGLEPSRLAKGRLAFAAEER